MRIGQQDRTRAEKRLNIAVDCANAMPNLLCDSALVAVIWERSGQHFTNTSMQFLLVIVSRTGQAMPLHDIHADVNSAMIDQSEAAIFEHCLRLH